MRVIIYGATGMVGQGVLRACLADPGIEAVLSVGRAPSGQTHAKLRDLVLPDLGDYSAVEAELAGYDACFFCLGISSAGLSEPDYHHVTYDLTLAAANALARRNPGMTFIYVSGAGTDATEKGSSMWARVKGKTENALFQLPFKAVMFRPGYIQPLHGIRSRTRLYRVLYAIVGPLYPLLKALFPRAITSTDQVARAMIAVARDGAPKKLLQNSDINAIAGEVQK